MTSLNKAGDVVRVERGAADASEVAAVVLVVLSRLAAHRQVAAESPDQPSDERLPWWEGGERYRAPRSWHA